MILLYKRICILCSVTFACLLFLSVRLYYLSGDENPSVSVLDGQYTTRLDITSRSGFVYDRYFNLLSHDKYTGILVVNPAECEDPQSEALEISKLSKSFKESEILEKIYEGIPFKLAVANTGGGKRLSERKKGIYFFPTYKENFSVAQHLLGYSRDDTGVTGLRYAYNSYLYEEKYAETYAVYANNAKRAGMSALEIKDSCSEKEGIITSIDKKLQSFTDEAEELVGSGCILVADGDTGEILAMSSFPRYDAENLGKYLTSEKGELINRAVCSFTPGSVFKLIVSAAALEKSSDYLKYTVSCRGKISVGSHDFGCHKKTGHGDVDMKTAFANSCNCYYISLAEEIGYGAIYDVACRLGLDKVRKADFLEETGHSFLSDITPKPETLANLSIGQGELCLSPLDMLTVTQAVTTGKITPLRVVLGKTEGGKNVFREEVKKEQIFSESVTNALCEMMEECVKTGTGVSARVDGIKSGGKTATAQTGHFDDDGVEYVHKWFCGFCDGTEKRYIFCVLSDNTTNSEVSPTVVSGKICKFLKENGY